MVIGTPEVVNQCAVLDVRILHTLQIHPVAPGRGDVEAHDPHVAGAEDGDSEAELGMIVPIAIQTQK